ncbi:MAG: DUF6992 family protein [Bacteroidota bacterium]
MKRSVIAFIIPFFLVLFLTIQVKGQPSGEMNWNAEIWNLQKNGMVVLGSWAAGNLLVSGYQMSQTSGKTYHFHQMNVFWNVVNAGIAVSGYLGAMNGAMDMSDVELLNEYNSFSKVLLLNTGLDVAYVMTGFYLKERSKSSAKHQKRLAGYGNSLMLQGGFLFLFDLALVVINEQSINEMLGSDDFQMALSPGMIQLRFSF